MVSNVTQQPKPSKNNFLIFSQKPVIDAAVWGAIGAAGGAIGSVIMQNGTLNNKDKFTSALKSLKEELNHAKSEKQTKNVEHAIKCLTDNKINYKSVRGWAIACAIVTFVPQLIINLISSGGKKAYDKMKKN